VTACTNCFTVDVEEWFHVCENEGPLARGCWDSLPSRVVETTRDLLSLLDGCGVRGTFFVLGWIAERYPALVAEIRDAGHEIGSHGHLHVPLYELTPEDFARDLAASRVALTAAGAPDVRGYRAPMWSINDRSLWALDELAGNGFTFDSSMAPLKLVGNPNYPTRPHTRSTLRGELFEFPPLVDRRFGQNMPLGLGWGLRMSSPRQVIRTIAERNRAGIPVALVVHPWELDPDPPRAPLPLSKRFAHYFRLDGFRTRLHAILRGALFAPMGEVLGLSRQSS
jgi:polysaccharide deacetylase family protein (PEP-CTERM system associated)